MELAKSAKIEAGGFQRRVGYSLRLKPSWKTTRSYSTTCCAGATNNFLAFPRQFGSNFRRTDNRQCLATVGAVKRDSAASHKRRQGTKP